MLYQVIVETSTVFPTEAKNEEEAMELVKKSLIESQQLKAADQFKITVAEEVKI